MFLPFPNLFGTMGAVIAMRGRIRTRDALVDIGAGTTDVQIYTDGSVRHTAVIPIAGDLITSDIAMALRTPTKDAEDIKVESGHAKQLLTDIETQVEVPGLGDRGPRMLSRQALAGVIEPRVEEIFQLVHQVIRESVACFAAEADNDTG
jgi:cell division protein FtsA